MMQEFSITNSALLAEVQSLREENERLKKNTF